MKFTSNHQVLLDEVDRAFELAVEDTLEDARRRAPKVTGRFAASLQVTSIERTPDGLNVAIGSPLSSARIKEQGGRKYRQRAQPTVGPAVEGFAEHMTERLRDQRGG